MRKNRNAGCRWYEDPNLPEGRRDAAIMKPIRLSDVPVHTRQRRAVAFATTPTASSKRPGVT